MMYQFSTFNTAIILVIIVLKDCYGLPQETSEEVGVKPLLYSDYKQEVRAPCSVTVQEREANIFLDQILKREPHFVQFKIRQSGNKRYNVSDDVFEPFRWSWTFNESARPYPFITFNIDYGILSFHLLETKSMYYRDEIVLDVSDDCNLTYGSKLTTNKIVEAFIPLINDSTQEKRPTFTENYFCHYRINPALHDYIYLARYFVTAVSPIIYSCSSVTFNYTSKQFDVLPVNIERLPSRNKWIESANLEQMIGVLAFLYFTPIIVLRIAGWTAKYEKIIPNEEDEEYEAIGEPFEDVSRDVDHGDEWIYADGITYPLNVSDIFSLQRLGLSAKYPILVGRLRRLIFTLLVPSFIIIKMFMFSKGVGMWDDGDKITVKMAVGRGLPMGFTSILGDPGQRRKVFVYYFGGPLGVICLYYALSFLFLILPRSVKQMMEDGLPRSRSCIQSPLFLTFSQTLRFSKIVNEYQTIPSGYAKANAVIKCRFYMLFALPFWQFTFMTQRMRWASLCRDQSNCMRISRCVLFPLYLIMCILEVFFSVMYYGVPLCSFFAITVNGISQSISNLKQQNWLLRVVFSFRVTVMVVLTVFSIYIYILSLVYLHSFLFISKIVGNCFVAVILYPQASFGYLFFFVSIFYYLVHLIQDFSNGYMELLSTAVDLSRQMNENNKVVTDANGQTVEKVQEKKSCFGIPKALFDILVQEFRPVHRELLSLIFKAAIIILFVYALLYVSSAISVGPTNEISDVMHVMFIVVVGALPSLVSSLLSHRNDIQLNEIKERQIREVIIRYWRNMDRE